MFTKEEDKLMALREELRRHGNLLFRFRSYLPLLFIPIIIMAISSFKYFGNTHWSDEIWEMVCLVTSLLGLVIRIFTIGHVPKRTSGRNTNRQIAEVLNTSGIYSLVRHPLYLGNFFMWLGIVMFVHSWWLTFTFVLAFWLYYERIMYAEEEFLRDKFGVAYLKWAERTPAFWPDFSHWQAPNLPFSWRNVLKREYHGLFGIVFSFTILEVTGDYIVSRQLIFDGLWIGIFAVNLVIYILLRFLVKKTRLLHEEGR
jgi:protein-S-isoprenylcysteine O-methyltransferase Ste14